MSNAEKFRWPDSSVSDIIINVGRHLLGKQYVGGVLDKPAKESLVINLEELDCVTFLESTVALAIVIKERKTGFEDFCNQLKFIRYRNGVQGDYTSRLHYFYEWIVNNQNKGILENITESIGGKPLVKNINFMSRNSSKYPGLSLDSSIDEIRKSEEWLNSLNKHYIPKAEIRQRESMIRSGDLIAITTTVEGLEVAHVGFAIRVNNSLHFMHASSTNKKVEVSELPLHEFIQNKASWSGIIVARLVH